MRAAAHSASQLMQLGKAESLRILDEHDGRVRHVDPHFDYGGGDQEIDLAAHEAAHDLLLLGRPKTAVDQADLELREALHQAFVHPGRRLQVEHVRLVDQRIDDVALPALRQLLPEKRKGRGAVLRPSDTGPHRRSAGR